MPSVSLTLVARSIFRLRLLLLLLLLSVQLSSDALPPTAFRCGLKQWSRRQRRNRVRQILTQHHDAARLKVRRRRPTSCLVIGRSPAPRVVAWQRLLAQVPADEPIGRRQGVTGRFANTLNAAVRAGSAPNKCSNDRNGSVIRKTN